MLTVDGVYAGYGGADVLKGVSFALDSGRSLCVLGPNGCGKTTLLRAIAALIPFRGDIRLDGQPVQSMKRRDIAARVAVMSQSQAAYFPYTVWDTVMLGRYQHVKRAMLGGVTDEDRAVVEECLRATGILDIRRQTIDALSGGQLQRVFLAKALAQQPEVILLDEPTNHLDVKCQVELIDYLKAWVATGKHTVVGVFHDINLALMLSDQLLFLKEGEVAGQGAFDDIASRAFLKDVYGMDVKRFMLESLGRWTGRDASDVQKSI